MRDADDLFKLLSIAEKSIQWPKLKTIHDDAMQALEEHAAELMKREEKLKPAMVAPHAAPPVKEVKEEKPVTSGNVSFTKPIKENDYGQTDSE